jgi:flagellar protein FlbD
MNSGDSADEVCRGHMIRLTRLNRMPLVLNSDLIEHIDVTPDTVITLTTGQILRVRETADQVIQRIVEFRRRIFGPGDLAPLLAFDPEEAETKDSE